MHLYFSICLSTSLYLPLLHAILSFLPLSPLCKRRGDKAPWGGGAAPSPPTPSSFFIFSRSRSYIVFKNKSLSLSFLGMRQSAYPSPAPSAVRVKMKHHGVGAAPSSFYNFMVRSLFSQNLLFLFFFFPALCMSTSLFSSICLSTSSYLWSIC